MEEIMLIFSQFRHNHHPSGVKMSAEFIQRGFWVKFNSILNLGVMKL